MIAVQSTSPIAIKRRNALGSSGLGFCSDIADLRVNSKPINLAAAEFHEESRLKIAAEVNEYSARCVEQVPAYPSLLMRMPILAYFVVIGIALTALLDLSSYALPDVGSPIKTSQLVGLPSVEPRPDPEPVASTFNFGSAKQTVDTQSAEKAYAKAPASPQLQNVQLITKSPQLAKKNPEASRERRVAVYSHDAMMNTH